MKKILKILIGISLLFLLIGAVNAADNSTTDTVTIEDSQNEETNIKSIDESQAIEKTKTTPQTSDSLKESKKVKCKVKATPVKSYVNQKKYFKISVNKNDGSKIHKHIPLGLKIKVGKKYRYYTLKTNTLGIARFGTKNLPIGIHKVSIYSKSKNYKIYATSKIIIKQYPHVIIKIKGPYANHAYKIVKKGAGYYDGYTVSASYSLGGQDSPGAYVCVDGRGSYTGYVYVKLKKAKFYFKNNKNGKIITRFATKPYNYYESPGCLGISELDTRLIKGYTPICVKVWYQRLI